VKLFKYKWFKKANRLNSYMMDVLAFASIGLAGWLIIIYYQLGGIHSTATLALWGVGFIAALYLAIMLTGAAHREKLSDRIDRLEERK